MRPSSDPESEALGAEAPDPDSRSGSATGAILANGGTQVAEGVQLWTILLSDLVGSTRLVEQLGDSTSAELFRLHDRLARDLLDNHDGLEIDKTDGFLLLFQRPWDAVRYALSYHKALADLSRSKQAKGVDLSARVGIHFGEVVLRRNSRQDIARGAKPLEAEGLAKPTAARMMSLAGGRQTLLTRSAFDLSRRSAVGEEDGSEKLRWLAHGGYLFKGVREPVEVFEVGVEGFAPLRAPEGSEKVARVLSGDTILGWRPAPGLAIPHRPNWVVEEKLGEGGFGEVWLASNRKLNERRVFKFCLEAERLKSLQREITLFRLLKEELGERDDIARILDWNLDEDPYFIESVYTEGGSLVDWVEAQGGIGGVPLAVRLEIVAQVATALAAAHSVGVLHKDVKPANVLITDGRDGPQAVLTDFGIGLVTDVEKLAAKGITVVGLTEVSSAGEGTETTAGTRLYLAPEVLEGKPATLQADIYALGVLLFQVVAGDLSRALGPGWERDVEDELLREDIAFSVDVNPSRRLGNALRLAERLRALEARRTAREAERRARDEAEQAARRARQEAERAARRRKFLTTVAALSTVFLIVVSVLAVQAMRAREDAVRGRAQAEQLIDVMLGDLHEGLEKIGRLDLLAAAARGSREYFESLTERDESADATYKRGLSLLNIGSVLLDEGDTEEALASSRSALELFERSAAEEPRRIEWRKGRILSRLQLGRVLSRQGERAAAMEAFEAALEEAKQVEAEALQGLQGRYLVARARFELADVARQRGHVQTAVEGFRETVELLEDLDVSGQPDWRHSGLLLEARLMLGNMLRSDNQLEAALEAYRRAGTMAERLVSDDPANISWRRKLAWIHYQTGAQKYSQQDLPGALEAFQSAVTAYRQLSAADPTRVSWPARLAESLRMTGVVRTLMGEPRAALEIYPESLRILENLVARDPARLSWLEWLARVHSETGAAHLRLGDTAAALASYTSVRDLRQRVASAGGDDPKPWDRLSFTHLKLGDVHARRGDHGQARRDWSRALELIEPVTARSDRSSYRGTHAQILLRLGRLDEARPLVEDLVEQNWDDPDFLQAVRESGLGQMLP